MERIVPRRTVTSSAAIAYPVDVVDASHLRELLADTDVFGDAVEEAEGYLADSLERFRVTMALVPELGRGAHVLELGANPYFLTRLLVNRRLDVTCANWFGPDAGFGERGCQRVHGSRRGWEHDFVFDHFNVERDTFPYADRSFDLVLCCEILEHLPTDPTHMLAEIHRVLKPAGRLLLTTPNAIRLDNLARLLDGRNVYEALSGYGVYGRHNREYTVDELRTLLTAAGFVVEELFARDVHAVVDRPRRDEIESLEDRGDNLFALAWADGETRWPYPRWLYQSVHAIRRVVRPDLVVGVNDDLQSAGLHVEESVPPTWRWTGPQPARITLAPVASASTLRVDGCAPPPEAGDTMLLRVSWPDGEHRWKIRCDGRPFSVSTALGAAVASRLELCVSTDRTWQPVVVGSGGDTRALGVAIGRIAVE